MSGEHAHPPLVFWLALSVNPLLMFDLSFCHRTYFNDYKGSVYQEVGLCHLIFSCLRLSFCHCNRPPPPLHTSPTTPSTVESITSVYGAVPILLGVPSDSC